MNIFKSSSSLALAAGLVVVLRELRENHLVSLRGGRLRRRFYVGQAHAPQDAKPTGTTLELTLEKEGYDALETEVTKDARLNVKALLGSMFIVPLGWILAYPKARHFVLKSKINDTFSMDAGRDGTMV